MNAQPVDVLEALDLIERYRISEGNAYHRSLVETRAAVAGLIEANREGMYEIATALADYTFSASKANAMNRALSRMEAALARSGGTA